MKVKLVGIIFFFFLLPTVFAVECEETPESVEIWKNDSIICSYSNDVLTCYETIEKQICIEEAVQPCEFKFSYSIAYENLSVEECFVIHKGNKLQCNPPLERMETLYEWSGTKIIGVTLPSCQEGDTYRIVLKVETRHPIKGNFEFYYRFGGFDYVENALFRVTVPKDTQLFYYSTKGSRPAIAERDNVMSYTWIAKNIEPLKQEMFMPPEERLIDIVTVSSFKDYTNISEWARKLFEPKIQPSTVKWKADEITNKTGEEAAKEIYDWVRNNIHYVPLEFGILTGFEPHHANDILSRGNGDCKDFSVILVSLLKAKGFEAEPALFTVEESEFPTLRKFYHVVVKLKLGDKIIWLDPTCESCPYETFPYSGYNRYVLPFASSTELEKTPPHKDIEVDTYTRTKYNIIDENLTKVSITIKLDDLISSESSRKELKKMTDEQMNKTFEEFAGFVCSNYYDLNFSFQNTNESYEPLITEIKLNCRELVKAKDNKLAINIFGKVSMPQYLSPPKREYDLYFGINSRSREEVEVKFPENYKVISSIESFSTTTPNFNYSFSYEKEKNKAVLIIESFSSFEVSKENYDTIKEVYKKLSKETIEPIEATKARFNFIYIAILFAALAFAVLVRKFVKFKVRRPEGF